MYSAVLLPPLIVFFHIIFARLISHLLARFLSHFLSRKVGFILLSHILQQCSTLHQFLCKLTSDRFIERDYKKQKFLLLYIKILMSKMFRWFIVIRLFNWVSRLITKSLVGRRHINVSQENAFHLKESAEKCWPIDHIYSLSTSWSSSWWG